MGGSLAQVQQGQPSGGGKSGQMGDSAGQVGTINDFLQQLRQSQQQTGLPQQPIPNAPTMPDGTMGGEASLPLQGANGVITNPATSGQPSMGMPNQYSNTVGMRDNQQNQQPMMGGGKGKGA
jgi:hypothetical protein